MRFLTVAILLVSACSTTVTPIKTVCMKEDVPVIFIPAPPPINRPVLPLEMATSAELQSYYVANLYVASIKTLEDYTTELESIVANYQGMHDQAQALQKAVTTAPTSTSNKRTK